jgi:hypothetical protein
LERGIAQALTHKSVEASGNTDGKLFAAWLNLRNKASASRGEGSLILKK